MTRRRKGRPAGQGAEDAGEVRRTNPMRRRVIMVAIVVVAGALVYLLSKQESPTGKAAPGALEGRVLLDGQPLGGVLFSFEGEDRSARFDGGPGAGRVTGISRHVYRATTDADGRYHVDAMQPGLTYTAKIHRPGKEKDKEKEKPLTQADGKLPAVDVRAGAQRFDIQLASPK